MPRSGNLEHALPDLQHRRQLPGPARRLHRGRRAVLGRKAMEPSAAKGRAGTFADVSELEAAVNYAHFRRHRRRPLRRVVSRIFPRVRHRRRWQHTSGDAVPLELPARKGVGSGRGGEWQRKLPASFTPAPPVPESASPGSPPRRSCRSVGAAQRPKAPGLPRVSPRPHPSSRGQVIVVPRGRCVFAARLSFAVNERTAELLAGSPRSAR